VKTRPFTDGGNRKGGPGLRAAVGANRVSTKSRSAFAAARRLLACFLRRDAHRHPRVAPFLPAEVCKAVEPLTEKVFHHVRELDVNKE
jgi:hypothetical protein